jgi:nucleotide-binding universal stress UspA family protein
MYRKIFVPVDGSKTSLAGVREAIEVAKRLGSEMRLFHVVDEFVLDYSLGGGVYGGDLIDAIREGGKRILDMAAALVREKGVAVSCRLVESIGGPAAGLIVENAKAWGADLIVMGTHGRRGLARLAMGSDAEGVVRESTTPVLLVHHLQEPVTEQRSQSVAATSPGACSALEETL